MIRTDENVKNLRNAITVPRKREVKMRIRTWHHGYINFRKLVRTDRLVGSIKHVLAISFRCANNVSAWTRIFTKYKHFAAVCNTQSICFFPHLCYLAKFTCFVGIIRSVSRALRTRVIFIVVVCWPNNLRFGETRFYTWVGQLFAKLSRQLKWGRTLFI